MLFQMLVDYISNNLFISKEEVHEKIAVYYALDKLTNGEFLTLFNMLYPEVEEVNNADEGDYGIMTLQAIYDEEDKIKHPLPVQAKDIVEKLYQAKKLNDASNKMETFVTTGQLTKLECLEMTQSNEEAVVIPEVEAGIMTLPELHEDVVLQPEPQVIPLSLEEETIEAPTARTVEVTTTTTTKKSRSKKKKEVTK